MTALAVEGRACATRLEWGALGALLVFTVLAALGYGVFALHPGMLPDGGLAIRIYNRAFPLFARAHIALAAVVLAVPLVRRTGTRWLPAAAFAYVAAFTAEHVGTGFGVPFGGYAYTGLLGPRLGGRVPFLIPASWFLMALPAYVVARTALPGTGAGRRASRLALTAATLTAWDLALDPAMSHLTPYWRWEVTGPYYGMPLVNLAGWTATGLVLAAGLEALGGLRWTRALPTGWMAAYYGTMLLMPVGMLVAAGTWGAVVATAAALAALATAARKLGGAGSRARSRGRRAPTRSAGAFG